MNTNISSSAKKLQAIEAYAKKGVPYAILVKAFGQESLKKFGHIIVEGDGKSSDLIELFIRQFGYNPYDYKVREEAMLELTKRSGVNILAIVKSINNSPEGDDIGYYRLLRKIFIVGVNFNFSAYVKTLTDEVLSIISQENNFSSATELHTKIYKNLNQEVFEKYFAFSTLSNLDKQSILQTIATLESHEADCIVSHFGLNVAILTQVAIAKKYRLSKSRIGHIIKKALRKLQHHSRRRKLEQFRISPKRNFLD